MAVRSQQRWMGRLAAAAAALTSFGEAFYLPGVAPTEYLEGAPVELKVNKLTSSKAVLPYDFYYLPFCEPKEKKHKVENLGEILMGDAIQNSPYEIKMRVSTTCQTLCTVPVDEEKLLKFQNAIDDEYMVNWMVDNLPAATRYFEQIGDQERTVVLPGYPVGLQKNGRYYIYNHVVLVLSYHSNPDKYEGYRVVGFEVEPYSSSGCTEGDSVLLELGRTTKSITFTYAVRWKESEVRWASRWDTYLTMTSGGQVHWFGILNSMLVVVFLSGMVALIMLRTLYRDIAKYNEIATEEEAKEETGWKLVHGDVFRAPEYCNIFCATVGTGVQLINMVVVVLIFALLGFLSPAHRGALLQSMMLLFTLMGVAGGFVTAKIYKLFRSDGYVKVAALTATLYPGIVFSLFFVLNLFIWGQGSSGAVPLTTMLAMLVLWFGISMPLVMLGARMGFNQPAIELPVKVSLIPRCIPEQPGVAGSAWATCLAGGLLPFGAVFTEIFFILSSIWHHRFYYLFGFLGIVIILLIITCAEISIALTYYQLTMENHRWWWRSMFTSGASAFYLLLYAIIYFHTRLQINTTVATLIYYGYMVLMSSAFFIFTGTVGFISSFFFVRGIYGSIKVD
eukprot:TRINITY_DN10402_c0_g2_i1.p1 TRINITY_DN10402_c0_g2~~TRINITY_DN10402_c0_g2_i1.p1  ORF type:complete len:619 (+),score=137.73 TRINITY_DN10402_c0_g2_i1:60-1916(+)